MPKWYEKYYNLLQKCIKKELDCLQNVSSSKYLIKSIFNII